METTSDMGDASDVFPNPKKKRLTNGKVCAVVNCWSSDGARRIWKLEMCSVHKGMRHEDCPCLVPYQMHRFPVNEDISSQWVVKLNRKDFVPTKHHVLCSKHFVDGRPTDANPIPELHMGYDASEKFNLRRWNIVQNNRAQDTKDLGKPSMPEQIVDQVRKGTLKIKNEPIFEVDLETVEHPILTTLKLDIEIKNECDLQDAHLGVQSVKHCSTCTCHVQKEATLNERASIGTQCEDDLPSCDNGDCECTAEEGKTSFCNPTETILGY